MKSKYICYLQKQVSSYSFKIAQNRIANKNVVRKAPRKVFGMLLGGVTLHSAFFATTELTN